MLDDGSPLFQQIARQVSDGVLVGTFPEGTQVPSTTELAALHRINPATVGKGLALLVAAAATAILVGAVTVRASGSRFGLLDAAALAAVGLVALELARGGERGDLNLLLPALITFATSSK